MPWITRRLPSAAILALSAVSAHAQDGDVAAGTPSLAKHAVPAIWSRPSSKNQDVLLSDRPSGTSPILAV
jgi:hypothetical protein